MQFPCRGPTVGVTWSAGRKLRVAEVPWKRTVLLQEELAENVSQHLRRMDRRRLLKSISEKPVGVLKSIEKGE